MNVVDSCGWLEYFSDGPSAKNFALAVENTASLLVPTICLHEVFRKVVRERDERMAQFVTEIMRKDRVLKLTNELSIFGARLPVHRHLPMTNALILATAHANEATL